MRYSVEGLYLDKWMPIHKDVSFITAKNIERATWVQPTTLSPLIPRQVRIVPHEETEPATVA